MSNEDDDEDEDEDVNAARQIAIDRRVENVGKKIERLYLKVKHMPKF